MTTVIETRGLTKRYEGVTAVDGLDLQIESGEIFGLLGPNGAGKTTTILMLLGLTRPSSGEVLVLGLSPEKEALSIKAQVGYLPENVGFYADMTARGNLEFVAELNGLSKIAKKEAVDQALTEVGLTEVAHRRVSTFSRGMRQRLGLAEVLVKKPKIMILDEPTLGLDPDGIDQILAIITNLSTNNGLSVVLSSHLLHLVERVAHRVAILHRGQRAAQGRVADLAAQAGLKPSLEEVYRHYFRPNQSGDSLV